MALQVGLGMNIMTGDQFSRQQGADASSEANGDAFAKEPESSKEPEPEPMQVC